MGRLLDGESRKMKSRFSFHTEFDVIARRVDDETPIVTLKHRETGQEFHLTDTDVSDTVIRIQRALSILPTSK